ncbi:hypothetical protein BsWGS_05412 [Bradybaena similaris]
MDNLPPSGFQFAAEDYGPVDFPGSLQSEMQAGMSFGGGGPVFPQNQRGSSYGMSPFHMNYTQQASMPSMSGLPSSFRSRFSDYASDQNPHHPMSIPSSASGMISDRLPSFSTIVSSSGSSSADLSKSSQALYSSISGQQHAFQPSGTRSLQAHFDSSSYSDQVSGKTYSKSPSVGSTSPGMSSSNYSSSIPHSSVLQHAAHNGSGQHLSSVSSRTFKEEVVNHQQYLAGSVHADRHGGYSHGGISQLPGESMTLPKFKHKYLTHSQHMPRRHIGQFKFFIVGKTQRPLIFNKGTQTNEECMGELKIKIPKSELHRPESDNDFSDDDGNGKRQRPMHNAHGTPRGSPRITFPYDPLPSQGQGGEFRDYTKNSKVKTVISPSFLDSAGKATMTTCVSNKATIVTVGIVSRPSTLLGEPTVSTYQKGIMATGNNALVPRVSYKHQNSKTSEENLDSSEEQNSENFEQLLEERKAKARDLEQERMELLHVPNKRYPDQNQIFGTSENYEMDDTKEVDKNEAEGRLLCRYCDRRFRYPSQLKDHMQSHNGQRPYMCTECGMDFMKEHHLKAHHFTHTGLKPYTCDICGRSFNQRANLQRHKLIHDTTRTFKCNICEKTFTQPQTLKAHQVVHADRKPFECSICGKEFGRYHNLQGHLHMHTNSKPYVCFCGSTFTLKGNLNRHKKVKHGLNETTDVMEEDAVNFLSSLSERVRDEHNVDGETDSLSPGSGAEGADGKTGRKGRKSIPRKINLGEGEAGFQQQSLPATESNADSRLQPPAATKPFVIQNPDTDEEIDYEEEDGEIPHMKEVHKNVTPATGTANFQPLNVGETEPTEDSLKRLRLEEHADVDKRPRRQLQRRSPIVPMNDVDHSETDDENVDNDNTDTDWVPGSRRRSRGKSDSGEKKN